MSLEESLFEEEFNELNIEENNYKVLDRDTANYFCKLINKLESEINNINKECDDEIEKVTKRVNSYRQKEVTSIQKKIDYFKNSLQIYAQNELEGSDKKSVKLIYGTLQFKKNTKYSYDDDKLKNFINSNGYKQFIETKEVLKKSDLKKAIKVEGDKVTLDGKVVDGLTAETENSFYFKPNKEE